MSEPPEHVDTKVEEEFYSECEKLFDDNDDPPEPVSGTVKIEHRPDVTPIKNLPGIASGSTRDPGSATLGTDDNDKLMRELFDIDSDIVKDEGEYSDDQFDCDTSAPIMPKCNVLLVTATQNAQVAAAESADTTLSTCDIGGLTAGVP
jgi:hypothetical protein